MNRRGDAARWRSSRRMVRPGPMRPNEGTGSWPRRAGPDATGPAAIREIIEKRIRHTAACCGGSGTL
ncbi:protein of unknown function [Cupriavidus taiwanensis]|nr:protein of unknown function [Cupriavidus taiwanensis]